MTLKSLYTISDLQYVEGEFSATLSFNARHEIFKGHFPNQPVVPGVVLVNILKDLCSSIVGFDVKLVKGTNIKFMNMIDPTENIMYSISGTFSRKEDKMIAVTASIGNEEDIKIKFKGIFYH